MPINFQPYRAQETDLLTPAMNMVKLKQDQEQMGLLRDYRQAQMQQMQAEQQKQQQQAQKQSFDEWLNIYDKISPQAAQAYAKNNPQSMVAFQGLDESVLYSNDFQADLADATKKLNKLKEISRDPRTIQEVGQTMHNDLMAKYGGKDRYKEALTQFGKGIPSEEQVGKGESQDVFQTLQMLPQEARPQYEAEQEAILAGKSPELHKQWLEQKEGKPDVVEVEIKGQKVKLPASVYVAHLDREAAREQAMVFHEENLNIRKQIADMQFNLRTRLPAAQVKDLNDKQVSLDRYANLTKSFEDAYGGKKFLGPTMTGIYERLGMDTNRVDWWKEFKMLDNQLRHDIFGATLTGYEKKSWESVTINENTDPKIIRNQMGRRVQIATDALQRQVQGFTEAGYGAGGQETPPKKTKSNDPLGIR